MCLVFGCADTNNGAPRKTATDRQNDALKDPFSYGPKGNQIGQDIPSVTGGSTGEFDRKAFDRDLDRVLNP